MIRGKIILSLEKGVTYPLEHVELFEEFISKNTYQRDKEADEITMLCSVTVTVTSTVIADG